MILINIVTSIIEEYNKIAWDLHLDVEYIKWLHEHEKNNDNVPKIRRMYARAIFSYIEGIIFQLKKLALENATIERVTFSEAELTLIKERKYRLKDNGDFTINYDLLDLLSNIKFTAKIFSRSYCVEYEASYSDNGWNSLKKAKFIRNRLTHPKSPIDLEISDEDYNVLKEAESWFWSWFLKLLEECKFHEKNKKA